MAQSNCPCCSVLFPELITANEVPSVSTFTNASMLRCEPCPTTQSPRRVSKLHRHFGRMNVAAGEDDVTIDARVASVSQRLIETRRDLHKNAQLSFQETYANGLIIERLQSLGLSPQTGLGIPPPEFQGANPPTYTPGESKGTGVCALIKGGAGAGPCIALRADMDALPIIEVSDEPYCSANKGAMHACGHDGHVAMLLAAAEVLVSIASSLRGSVLLMFQPAEEFGGGAQYMVQEGVLDGEGTQYN